jgi:hypothetical protein
VFDLYTRCPSELYAVIEYPGSGMSNVRCEICHLHIPWSVELDNPEVGSLIWHDHLVTEHPGVALQRMSTIGTALPEHMFPQASVSFYSPRACQTRGGESRQRRLIRGFRECSHYAVLSAWTSQNDELQTASCGLCGYKKRSVLGLDRESEELDMNYHLLNKHPKKVVHLMMLQARDLRLTA